MVVLISIVVGLASAVRVLGHGPNVPASDRGLALGFGLAAVVLGWFLIHTTFIFRYAHLYYHDDNGDGVGERGLIFPGDQGSRRLRLRVLLVRDRDDVPSLRRARSPIPSVRREVLLHGILSFAYNTAILALGVNLVSSIINSPSSGGS